MTTGDEDTANLVDNLFREVDDQVRDLEREYQQARQDLAASDVRPAASNPISATTERYEIMSEVASLRAEVARQADELDERDRLLAEIGERVAQLDGELAARDALTEQLRAAHNEALVERREQARLKALLDARAAEREELAEVAKSLQNERDHVQDLLTTALARFDQLDAVRIEMDAKLRHLQAARDTASREHDARAYELIESRAEMSRLVDQLAELSKTAEEANANAARAEALAERRGNEANYLNRRIDALTERASVVDRLEQQIAELERTKTLAERRTTELERELAASQAEAAASAAAVEALAERASRHDELVARIVVLEQERDDAWLAASGASGTAADLAEPVTSADVDSLAARARELGLRRTIERAAAEAESPNTAAGAAPAPAPDAAPVANSGVVEFDGSEQQQSEPAAAPPAPPDPTPWAGPTGGAVEAVPVAAEPAEPEPRHAVEAVEDLSAYPDPPKVPRVDFGGDARTISLADVAPPAPAAALAPVASTEPDIGLLSSLTAAARKRAILPEELTPNTPEAVRYLLGQRGVVAVIDARSTCGKTGIRPSDLFARLALVRDQFDLPIEVVVTPVSTPVGGAPDLPQIGVHHVTGADTVADRVRGLCMGLPGDQPIVVISGDDHVRRAAIGEEANVVEPAALLDLVVD